MKLRKQSEDFVVDERSALPIGNVGQFAAYRLTKRHWSTLDALERISRELNLARRNIRHAGLKDRHAATSQLITIRNGPRRSYAWDQFELEYLGQAPRGITADDIQGNQFRIVLRSLSRKEADAARRNLPCIRDLGLVNYFDDQRFGSYFPGKGLIAEPWIRNEFEEALRLAFAEPHPADDATEREQKTLLRTHWGDWEACKQALARSHRRSIVTYLCDHPADFKGAWSRVNADWRGLWLSALQSDLWNQIASAILERACGPDRTTSVELLAGAVRFPLSLNAEQGEALRAVSIPLPSARTTLTEFPEPELVEATLRQRGWALQDLKVKTPRDRFFARSRRPLMIPVEGLEWTFDDDDLSTGLEKGTLSFVLPRGAYATMLVKQILAETPNADLADRPPVQTPL